MGAGRAGAHNRPARRDATGAAGAADSTMPQRASAFAMDQEPVTAPSPTRAHAWLHTARFLTEAVQLAHLPALEAPEIAFVGRSNAGKSTCINTLAQQRQLAFASRTPGRTQNIVLFAVGRQGATDAVLADLPGYGYAAVPQAAKRRWQHTLADYLVHRPNLRAVVLLCDARLGLTELDQALLELIRPRVERGLDFLVLLTKADKLSRREQARALSIARLQTRGGEASLFSALKRQGLDEVALTLWRWAHAAPCSAHTPTDTAADSAGSAPPSPG